MKKKSCQITKQAKESVVLTFKSQGAPSQAEWAKFHLLRAFWSFKLRVDENFVEKKNSKMQGPQSHRTGDMVSLLQQIYFLNKYIFLIKR